MTAIEFLRANDLDWGIRVVIPWHPEVIVPGLSWIAQNKGFTNLKLIKKPVEWCPTFLQHVAGAYMVINMDQRVQCGRVSADAAMVKTPCVASASWERQGICFPDLTIPGGQYIEQALEKCHTLLDPVEYQRIVDQANLAVQEWSSIEVVGPKVLAEMEEKFGFRL
jgi:hypothetical protein